MVALSVVGVDPIDGRCCLIAAAQCPLQVAGTTGHQCVVRVPEEFSVGI